MQNSDLMDKIVSLCKRRGFIFPGSEIYGGMANSWDFGPVGVELKNNLRDWWWQRFVQSREDMVGIDSAIIMNPKVWEASGHLREFNDPLVECDKCHKRFRWDDEQQVAVNKDGKTWTHLDSSCGFGQNRSQAKQFNLMFKTFVGTTEESANMVFLRPEIAQAMFVNFKNVLDTTRKRLPFGIAAVGKVFRNEISPGNFIFRTLEFDLMEFEYFIRESEWQQWFEYWLNQQQEWLKELGFKKENIRLREHKAAERAHYSKRTLDIEYHTPFGWKEMFGLAYRTDYDLKNHFQKSGQELVYTDPDSGEKFIPHVIEPTFGLTRLVLMTLLESYYEDQDRVVLKFHPRLAPYKVAVFPLLANKPQLVQAARKIYDDLRGRFMVAWDDRGNVGKRYYSQDEIGTPYCITVDFQSLDDGTVTVRDRDTKEQPRVKIAELVNYFKQKLSQ